ncbi:hypothetical protein AgCh_013709 [Apium graveolens]
MKAGGESDDGFLSVEPTLRPHVFHVLHANTITPTLFDEVLTEATKSFRPPMKLISAIDMDFRPQLAAYAEIRAAAQMSGGRGGDSFIVILRIGGGRSGASVVILQVGGYRSIVKFRRRKEGKTEYRVRIWLINQDKNTCNTPKYRFVVRFTYKDIIAQIIFVTIIGDMILATAYSHELPRYGLDMKSMKKMLRQPERITSLTLLKAEDLLELSLMLDGALDNRPNKKQFSGFLKDSKQLDVEVHNKYIYGGHVSAYMRTLLEDEPEKYQTHFSLYAKKGIDADNIDQLVWKFFIYWAYYHYYINGVILYVQGAH